MKKNILLHILILACLMTGISCRQNPQADAEKLVRKWIGKEILLPEDLPCLYMGQDTLCPPPSLKPFKVLVYTDSIGCTSCQLNLQLWQVFMEDAESVAPGQVDFLFYFQPKNKKELSHLLRRERMQQTVFVDTEQRLPRINNFPDNIAYQCFLLDQDNKVLSIGNPTLNPEIWNIYKKLFTQNTEE